MIRRRVLGQLLVSWLFATAGASLAAAPGVSDSSPLTSSQLLLVYNAENLDSQTLALYYARVRNVPKDRILDLHVSPDSEDISAADFDRLIRRPIKEYLTTQNLKQEVRCLVTFYGLPLRVGKQQLAPDQDRRLAETRRRLAGTIEELERAVIAIESLAQVTTSAPTSARAARPEDYPALLKRYTAARSRAQGILAKSAAGAPTMEAQRRFLALVGAVEGSATLLAQFGSTDPAAQGQLAQMKELIRSEDKRVAAILAGETTTTNPSEALQILQQNHGLLGLLRILDAEINSLRPEETDAAVDSELTLLWWESYPRYRWIYNPQCWRNRADEALRRQLPPAFWVTPTLMVARLDGPTPRTVRRMIDDSVAVESAGMSGTVYLDARGIKKGEGFGVYDQDLRDLAALLWLDTSLPTRLDNRPEVFAAGACPNAMLYCGWYSLRKYVPSMRFVRGAVGFHIASFEAISLKKADEQGWCKGLLADGAAATIGPVAEPYLHSFPRPREFFGLLLTGRFTLAECFAYTSPLNSWMQILLGDPLYRPFANRPLLTIDKVFPDGGPPPEAPATSTKPTG